MVIVPDLRIFIRPTTGSLIVFIWKTGCLSIVRIFFFFQAEDGIRDIGVTGVQTCALPIYGPNFRELVYSPSCLEKPYEKSGEGPNHYPTKRRKRLDRAPFQCFALPKNLSKGSPNYFSYGVRRGILGSSDSPGPIRRGALCTVGGASRPDVHKNRIIPARRIMVPRRGRLLGPGL